MRDHFILSAFQSPTQYGVAVYGFLVAGFSVSILFLTATVYHVIPRSGAIAALTAANLGLVLGITVALARRQLCTVLETLNETKPKWTCGIACLAYTIPLAIGATTSFMTSEPGYTLLGLVAVVVFMVFMMCCADLARAAYEPLVLEESVDGAV
jgi:hypothetical protein